MDLAVHGIAELVLRIHVIWPSVILPMDGRRGMCVGPEWESVMALTVVCSNVYR